MVSFAANGFNSLDISKSKRSVTRIINNKIKNRSDVQHLLQSVQLECYVTDHLL